MIGYITIGTSDLGRAERFYDSLFVESGSKKLFKTELMIAGVRILAQRCCV